MWFPIIMLVWGIIITLTGLVTNYTGLVITRTFLGVAEAGLFPVSDTSAMCCISDANIFTGRQLLHHALVRPS